MANARITSLCCGEARRGDKEFLVLCNKLINVGINQSRILNLVTFNSDTLQWNETLLCKKNMNQILGENLSMK